MDYYQEYLKYRNKFENLLHQVNKKEVDKNIFPINDEIQFWSKQLMEHQLFLFLGLEDMPDFNLKSKAYEIYSEWKDFIKNISENIDIKKVNELINKTSDFTRTVISELSEGKWIGWIFPSLARHMLEESEYFSRKINGPLFTTMEEIEYINKHNGEELAVTAQLIDPNREQQKVIDIVRSYANQTKISSKWSEKDEKILRNLESTDLASYLMISIRYGKEIIQLAQDTGKKIASRELKSIISPILAEHGLREFERFTKTLEIIQSRQNSN